MKKILALLGIIIIIMTACQKTPEELIVQSKADNQLMEKIENTKVHTKENAIATQANIATTSENAYKTISHEAFEQTLVNGMQIIADADVVMPSSDAFPIVKYKRKQFSNEDINNILNVLIGDKTLYEYEIPVTKSQIEAWILSLKQKLAQEELSQEEKDNINMGIEDFKRQLDTASDIVQLGEISRQLNENGQIFGKVLVNENTYASVNILSFLDNNQGYDSQQIGIRYSVTGRDNMSELSNKLSYIRQIKLGELTENINVQQRPSYYSQTQDWNYDISIEPVENAEGKITMTRDEAIKIAEDTFQNMGAGDDVKVSNIYYLYIPEDANCPKEDIHCYAVELKRYIGDMPIEVEPSSSEGMEQRTNDGNDEFNAGVPYECMSVLISDDGIIDLEWREPMEVVEVMNTNIELIPYKKIQEVFKQELVNSYSSYSWRTEDEIFTNENSGSTTTYYAYSPCDLYSIELNYGMARVPNENDCFMAIPLWDFYVKYTANTIAKRSDGTERIMGGVNDFSLLTINGIDSTRFSRRWGY